jgi:hypothetical protein
MVSAERMAPACRVAALLGLSLGVTVIGFVVIIVIFFAVVFVFLFVLFLVGLLSPKQDIGSYRPIWRV